MFRAVTGLGLAAWVAGCTGLGYADPAGADHGAAPFAKQAQQVEALVAGFDPAAAPKWVDPVVWKSLIPDDNAPTAARIALGRKLYFDPRLSKDKTVACATCHDVTRSFTDRRPASEGIGGKVGRRSAPTTMNAALLASQFWDGRAARLEDQAILPITNPIEMGQPDGAAVLAAIATDPSYAPMFQAAYGRAPKLEDVGRALASFERTLIFLEAPFDRWARGEAGAISDAAKRGFVLFNGKGRCMTCHPINAANPIGSDGRFHNIGVSARHQDFTALATKALAVLAKNGATAAIDELALGGDTSELGRFVVTRIESDIGGFRTSQLRNIGITAPYMHDGSMQTLWDVIDHYNRGGEANPYLDGGIEPLALSDTEIDELVAFLFTLTDRRFADANTAALAEQRAKAQQKRPFREDDLAQRRKISFRTTPAGGKP
ncbi:MAG TPA: cytochrome c peroxidase [Kofleriaceae bacterium]|nr:cytochrome c peroxidase [Kofleriaceae bacterium]